MALFLVMALTVASSLGTVSVSAQAEDLPGTTADESGDAAVTDPSIESDTDEEIDSVDDTDEGIDSDEGIDEEIDSGDDSVSSAGSVSVYPMAGSSISDASSLTIGTTYTGTISSTNTIDVYKFSLSSSGNITITSTFYMKYLYYYVYDESGSTVWYSRYNWDSSVSQGTVDETLDLTSGTYYLGIKQSSGYGNYTFKLGYTSAGESFTETQGGNNNSLDTADSISLNTTYKGQIATNDSEDFYVFKLSKTNAVTLISTAYMKYLYYRIYDSDGNQVWYSRYNWNSSTGKITVSESITLSAGTYYLKLEQSSGTGNYSVKLSMIKNATVTLSATTLTYTGKTRTPSVTVYNAAGKKLTKGTDYTLSWSSSSRKNTGKYTVTVTGKGEYAGLSKTKSFIIKPAKAKTPTLKSSTKKKLTVSYSKSAGGVTGYQIAYRVKGSSTWKYTTTKSLSKTISGLKSGKTYYVKVRAYKTISGSKKYGSWSTTKSKTVK